MKFGGTSVGDIDRIKNAAAKVVAEVQRGHKVAVVVSAMSGVTDRLIGGQAISPRYDRREHDAVVASGEQVTSGLMAMAIHQRGLNARSWQGWQARLLTDSTHAKARIRALNPAIWKSHCRRRSRGHGRVSGHDARRAHHHAGARRFDTSAVALAVALKADRCDIYTDVDGVYTTDPRIVEKARKMSRVSYEEMLELASGRQGFASALGRNGHALPHAGSGSIDIRQRDRQRAARHFSH